ADAAGARRRRRKKPTRGREDTMKIRFGIALALLALVLPIVAQAGPATTQTVDVTGWIEGVGPTRRGNGEASLVRNDSGISMTFRTTGLPAGEPVTIWW